MSGINIQYDKKNRGHVVSQESYVRVATNQRFQRQKADKAEVYRHAFHVDQPKVAQIQPATTLGHSKKHKSKRLNIQLETSLHNTRTLYNTV